MHGVEASSVSQRVTYHLTHNQSDASLQLHITIVRTRTVVALTTRGTMSAPPFISPSPAASGSNLEFLMIIASPRLVPAPLNDFVHGGYVWCTLGRSTKTQVQAAHDRDRAAEQRDARHRRINEARDSVPGSQDSLVRRVHNLQLGDTPEALTAPPAPAPVPMPNSRRLRQARPKQQPREYLRCAQCGPDPSAFRGALDHGLMLHMVQKHCEDNSSSKKALHSAQQRNPDRAACVSCVTPSGRDGAVVATSAEVILHSETSSLAIPSRTVDNPDTRMQRLMAHPPFSNLLQTSHPLLAERDKQPPTMAFPLLHCLIAVPSFVGREPQQEPSAVTILGCALPLSLPPALGRGPWKAPTETRN